MPWGKLLGGGPVRAIMHSLVKHLRNLHRIGIRHGDINQNNFIVTDDKLVLIDFQTAKVDSHRDGEMDELKECLENPDSKGFYANAWDHIQPKVTDKI